MTLATMQKAPGDKLDYDVDFSDWLVDGDTLVSAEVTISGGTAIIALYQVASTYVKVWVDDGLEGETNDINVVATTLGGRTKTECFRLRIKDC